MNMPTAIFSLILVVDRWDLDKKIPNIESKILLIIPSCHMP